ncbi:hypothetical protein [Absidia glauca]|nr:hypothetical protein [Absidia glauca]
MVTFTTLPRKKKGLEDHTPLLCIMARVLTTVWQQHWATILDDDLWSSDKAYSKYLLHLWQHGMQDD